jgi:hypothetical protein
MSDDPLEAIVTRAAAEGVLTPERAASFARALRERAEIILAERVRPLEDKAASLDREVAWRAGQVAALERETAWRAGQVETLQKAVSDLQAEHHAALSAHDRLLEHHRRLVGEMVAALAAFSAGLPWQFGRVRKEMERLAEVLRGELG